MEQHHSGAWHATNNSECWAAKIPIESFWKTLLWRCSDQCTSLYTGIFSLIGKNGLGIFRHAVIHWRKFGPRSFATNPRRGNWELKTYSKSYLFQKFLSLVAMEFSSLPRTVWFSINSTAIIWTVTWKRIFYHFEFSFFTQSPLFSWEMMYFIQQLTQSCLESRKIIPLGI